MSIWNTFPKKDLGIKIKGKLSTKLDFVFGKQFKTNDKSQLWPAWSSLNKKLYAGHFISSVLSVLIVLKTRIPQSSKPGLG